MGLGSLPSTGKSKAAGSQVRALTAVGRASAVGATADGVCDAWMWKRGVAGGSPKEPADAAAAAPSSSVPPPSSSSFSHPPPSPPSSSLTSFLSYVFFLLLSSLSFSYSSSFCLLFIPPVLPFPPLPLYLPLPLSLPLPSSFFFPVLSLSSFLFLILCLSSSSYFHAPSLQCWTKFFTHITASSPLHNLNNSSYYTTRFMEGETEAGSSCSDHPAGERTKFQARAL